jgi:hypothetical protein
MRLIGLSQEQLYEMAYLAGCDVQPKKHFSIEVAIDLLKSHGTITELCNKDLLAVEHVGLFQRLRPVWP